MQNDILQRAKLLAAAANQVAEEMSLQAQQYKDVVRARHAEETQHQQEIQHAKAEKEKDRKITVKDIGQHKTVRAAAIQGSTLITTYADIRPFAPRGSSIYIDDVEYHMCEKGEWTANRIQLTEDYRGDTNLDAEVKIFITEGAVKAQTRSPKRVPKPVATGDILGAVQGLDSAVGTLQKTTMQRSQLPAPKKLVKQPSLIKPPTQQNKSTPSIETHANSYTPATIVTTPTRTYAESSVTIHDSPEASHSAIDTSYVLPKSPITVQSNVPSDDTLSAAPPTDDVRMLQEIRHIELYCQDELVQRRSDMHKRLAQTGQQKAAERVQERKRMEILNGDDDMAFDEASKRSMYTEEELQERRRLAQQRVLQKRHEDERRLHERLQAEQAKQEQLKKRMEEKAEQLRQVTAQRVADYNALKRLEQMKERERQEAEAERRRQRELEFADAEKLKRALKLKEETELRLQQRQAKEEELRRQEALRVEQRLKELARLRGRTVMDENSNDNNTVESGARTARSASSSKGKRKKHRLPKVEGAYDRSLQVIASVKSCDTTTAPASDLKLPDIRVSMSERSHQRTVASVPPLAMKNSTDMHEGPKIIPAKKERNSQLPPRSKQPVLDIDDDVSIDSLVEHKEQNHDQSALNDNMSYVSALTLDTDLASEQASQPSNFTNSKIPRPKKKREVWKKLQPIPVKPYVPVPGGSAT